MLVINVVGIGLSFGVREILKDISFNARYGEKIGIVGVNGAGKTTLLKIISGDIKPDSGDIFISKDIQIGYMKQEDEDIKSMTLHNAVLDMYKHLITMERNLSELEQSISIEKNEDNLENIMKRYSLLSEEFSQRGGYEYRGRVKGILRGLGFTDEEFELKVSTLSGGQRTRLMMARLLSQEPDILLLDEPTNHLDVNAVNWLESFIKDYKKTCFIVSHDRYFLDKVCSGIFEVENTLGNMYKGNYTAYVQKKQIEREVLQKNFEDQQKEVKRLEDFVEQQRRWNRERNIIAAESRIKAIDRMEKITAPQDLPQKIKFNIRQARVSGNDVLDLEDLAVDYPGRKVFENISFDIKRGERVFIIGSNGCGKSTLLKAITSKVRANKGSIKFGHNVEWAYYDQDFSGLNLENSSYDEILSMDEVLSQTEIRNVLAAFGFKGDDVFKKINSLSGGEKSRVLLSKMILKMSNLIIMDEPTNHLDINSREVLEEAILEYDGTLICVSHDRYFINKLATRIISFTDDGIFDFKGNFEDYLSYIKSTDDNRQGGSKPEVITESKEKFMASKEQKARERKYKKTVEETEAKIEKLEKRLEEINQQMESNEILTDHVALTALFKEKEDLSRELESLLEFWESLLSGDLEI